MIKRILRGLTVLTILLSWGSILTAATWEFHPGLYTSYLYSDNYRGVAENEQSESTYAVGPSLALSCVAGILRWELAGHFAKEYHNRFEEDETTTGRVETSATARGQRQSLALSYSYEETMLRETLDEAWGLHRYHTGMLTYSLTATPAATLTVGYTRTMDNAPAPDEDVVSDGGRAALAYSLTPRHQVDLSAAYTAYRYEVSSDADATPDVNVSEATLRWRYALQQHLRLGPDFSFERHDREDFETEDIYTASLGIEYDYSQNTSMTASIGHSWLRAEETDNYETTDAGLGLTHHTGDDTLTAHASQGYAYEYTSTEDTSGIAKTTAYDIAWEHAFTTSFLATLGSGVTKREYIDSVEEDGTDITHRFSLIYRYLPRRAVQEPTTQPTEQLSVLGTLPRLEARATYEHLQHDYETSDTVRENRYGITVEVRY